MKKTIIFLSLLMMLTACDQKPVEDSLEVARRFKPYNKDFKPIFKTIFFMMESQSPSYVDSIYERYAHVYKFPKNAAGCKDGIYTGESPRDAYDYFHRVTISIKDEKIASIDYDEISADGIGKEKDESYNNLVDPHGAKPADVFPVYEKEMIEKQDYMKVDGITGATYSLFRFRYALTIALMKARLGETD